MTEWLWLLLAFEAIGWVVVALFRNGLALYLTTAILLVALTLSYDLPNDPHLYFAVIAIGAHILFYFAVALLVLWAARKAWPKRPTPTVE